MLGARWLLPLLLVAPLAAHGAPAEHVTGHAASFDEPAPPAPRADAPAPQASRDDGVRFLGARVLPREEAPEPELVEGAWSVGPSYHAERALDASSTAPPALQPPSAPPDDEASEASPAQPEAPEEAPRGEAPSEGEPEPAPAPGSSAPALTLCVALCFTAELGLL
ncbi:MAG TPA: hypothetical protein VFH78_06055 [Candidatus Thermoplasmatota archaeon]|nr:hypothetical protein [Candidatus Thermoplasmatota archaeon]